MTAAIVNEKCVEVIIKTDEPFLKPIELKDIGFLKKEPTYINCPACEAFMLSTIHLEPVTCFQHFLHLTNLGKNWRSRNDINHYCSKCGCFIGRYIAIGCGERCISKSARKKAAADDMSLKTKPKDCAANMQKMREHVKSEQAKTKARKAEVAKKTAEENAKQVETNVLEKKN